MKMLKAITIGIKNEIAYFVKVNARYAAALIGMVLPYVMYLLGQTLALDRGEFAVGSEVVIPIVCIVIIYYTREAANLSGEGNSIPIPAKRFTSIDNEGEVSVENNRLQELLLYVADLEDWLERKGRI